MFTALPLLMAQEAKQNWKNPHRTTDSGGWGGGGYFSLLPEWLTDLQILCDFAWKQKYEGPNPGGLGPWLFLC
jgi:hypothetical protein